MHSYRIALVRQVHRAGTKKEKRKEKKNTASNANANPELRISQSQGQGSAKALMHARIDHRQGTLS